MMEEAKSGLVFGESGEVTTVRFLERNIIEEAHIQEMGNQILDRVDNLPIPKMLIDFTEVDHLSSAALGQLITINNKIRQKEGQLRLANIDPQILEVFVITKLNKLFHIHDTAEEALEDFQ
ncbi:MAG: STAS domain-containing protein [Phycisphaerae bacterium]|nr:STAS domain-containing protein [Phycisphaerae bacterium]